MQQTKAIAAKRMLRFYEALGVERIPFSKPDPAGALKALRAEIGGCQRCRLHKGRKSIVFGEGNPTARLMFIGEGPGELEDAQGHPFAGEPGDLLNKLINRMGLRREDVYIAYIVKCRTPESRDPKEDEKGPCMEYLRRQVEIIRPEVIMTLGRIAASALLGPHPPITKLRGKFHKFEGVAVMPTFHPAYLLRTPKDKMLVWADAQDVLRRLGMEIK